MSEPYVALGSDTVRAEDLCVARARESALTLKADAVDYVTLVECRRFQGRRRWEAVVFDVVVDRAPGVGRGIRARERIAAVFDASDARAPWLIPLRPDFPLTPHVLTDIGESLRSLCLTTEPFADQKLRWTAQRFFRQLCDWLAAVDRGELHGSDQPLEPLLGGGELPLVLPSDLFQGTAKHGLDLLMVVPVLTGSRKEGYVAQHPHPGVTLKLDRDTAYVAVTIRGSAQAHGASRADPTTLVDLHRVLASADVNVISELRGILSCWVGKEFIDRVLPLQLVIIVLLPASRDGAAPPEAEEVHAYACARTIKEIGWRVGGWSLETPETGKTLSATAHPREIGQAKVRAFNGTIPQVNDACELTPFNAMFALSRAGAARLNGTMVSPRRLVAVGVGALGSQVCMNLVRRGYGEWVYIDHDRLLPHNLARHALSGSSLVRRKAVSLAEVANETIDGPEIAIPIVADVLSAPNKRADVGEALARAEVIVDMSASIAVERYLARDVDVPGRRVSLFLTPSGQVAVLLAEPRDRRIRLDALEMQYYRHLIATPTLDGHLRPDSGPMRYAGSCRDVTSALPQDLVASHAAAGSRALRSALDDVRARIVVWEADPEGIDIVSTTIAVCDVVEQIVGAWTVCVDQGVLDKIERQRALALPNETGGVLMGSFDMERGILYVVDALPSPPDSEGSASHYVRGHEGLLTDVARIERVTDKWVGYVGEWHSHPDPPRRPMPSADDRRALGTLAKKMADDGLPALMLVAGGRANYSWSVSDARNA